MSELAGVLSSINSDGTVPHIAKQNIKQGTFNEKKIHKVESDSSQSKSATSSSIKSQWDTKKTSSTTTPSSLANTKTSFLQSIITSPSTTSDLALQGRNNSEAFMQEKNSVISQLKNLINDDPTPPPVSNMAKRSFNAVPKGFQAPDLTGPADSQVSSSDPLVKKMVYNQYREMLKSYTS